MEDCENCLGEGKICLGGCDNPPSYCSCELEGITPNVVDCEVCEGSGKEKI